MELEEKTFMKKKVAGIPVYSVLCEPKWIGVYEEKYGVVVEFSLRKDYYSDVLTGVEVTVKDKHSRNVWFEVHYTIGRFSRGDEELHQILERAMLKYVTEEFEEGHVEQNMIKFAKIWECDGYGNGSYEVGGIWVLNQKIYRWEKVGSSSSWRQIVCSDITKRIDLVWKGE